jgi:precorrin-3B methylase
VTFDHSYRSRIPDDIVVADYGEEIDRLRAEVAALKAHDPLAEMWRELAEYQPFADRDGHGESWRRMCEERTEEAAERAQDTAQVASISSGLTDPWVAAMCARLAVAWRHHSEQDTQQSIGAIRRAKEAKR